MDLSLECQIKFLIGKVYSLKKQVVSALGQKFSISPGDVPGFPRNWESSE